MEARKERQLRAPRTRTITGDGEVVEKQLVYCPSHHTAVEIDECIECSNFRGLRSADGTWIYCAPMIEEVAEALSGAGDAKRTPIADLMSRDVVCATKDVSLEALTAMMIARAVSGVPIVDAESCPIGVVTKTDLLQRTYDLGDTVEIEPSEAGFHVEQIPAGTAADVMTPLAVSLPADAPVAQAAALMAYEGIHRLLVTANGKLVGILSPLDVLRWVGRRSGYVVPQSPQRHRMRDAL